MNDSPPRPLLYSYRRCPYAMRARMALLQAGHAFDVCEITLREKPPAMLALSPKGTVPVLQLPGGRVLEESLDIMRWAWIGRDNDRWWARAQTRDNLSLLDDTDRTFKYHLDRYKYPERFPGEGSRQTHQAGAVEVLLIPLEARLRTQSYLGGARPCATDLAIFPFVRQFAAVDTLWFDALPYPALRTWLDGWLESPLFEACMTRISTGLTHPFPGSAPPGWAGGQARP